MRVRATEQGEGGTLFVLRFVEEIDTLRPKTDAIPYGGNEVSRRSSTSRYTEYQRTQPSDMEDVEERAISGLTIRIDRSMCIGSDSCTKLAPEIFELGEDTIVTFLAPAPDIEQGRLLDACSICPVDALIVIDKDGQQIVP